MNRRRCGCAGLDEILPRHLERRLDRLRAAGHEVDPLDALGRARDQVIGQLLGGLAREEARVGVGEPVQLVLDRLDHARMAVAEAGHGSATAGIEVAPAGPVDERAAVTGDRDRVVVLKLAMEDVAHRLWSDPATHAGCRRRPRAHGRASLAQKARGSSPPAEA